MFKYLVSFFIFIFPLTTFAYSLITKVIDGHQVRIFHIPYNDRYRVKAVATNTSTSLQNLVKNGRGVAGINGAYFTWSDRILWTFERPNSVRIINGIGFLYSRLYPDTGINWIFGFLADNTPILVQNNMYGNRELRDNFGAHLIWGIESGIANFPILLVGSVSLILKYNDLGLLTDSMKNIGTKSFICRTSINDIKMGVIENISIFEVSDFILRFDCVDAINLDATTSLTMYDKKRYIIGPGRNILDAFIIVKK